MKNMDCFVTRYDIDPPDGAECAVLEDSIMQKGHPVTAGSKMLHNFISPIDATVVTLLESAGVTIIGKAKMSEFGVSGLFSYEADQADEPSPCYINGSVEAVAEGIVSFALVNDYTGAISREAALRGLSCIRPTYGTVSRYGLIPSVPSMDQISIICKTPEDGQRILSIIGKTGDGSLSYHEWQDREPSPVLPCVAADFELPHSDVLTQVMQILCCGELSSSLSRYDGVKFGHRTESYDNLNELYTKSRTEAFGPDAKLVAITGAMVLSQDNYNRYYDKAMRLRRLIKESLRFYDYNVIMMRYPSVDQEGISPVCFLPSLCGLPALTVPHDGGVLTLIADAGREDMLFQAIKVVSL